MNTPEEYRPLNPELVAERLKSFCLTHKFQGSMNQMDAVSVAYANAMTGMDLDAFHAACDICVRECTYFPKPKDIIAAAKGLTTGSQRRDKEFDAAYCRQLSVKLEGIPQGCEGSWYDPTLGVVDWDRFWTPGQEEESLILTRQAYADTISDPGKVKRLGKVFDIIQGARERAAFNYRQQQDNNGRQVPDYY